jgi:uncharacterized integral membrane protein
MKNRRIHWRPIGVLTLVVLFVIIVLQNTQVVDIQVLFWRLSMSRIILLFFCLVVGFVGGYYVRGSRQRSGADHTFIRKTDGPK